jgi:hypothetical protein
MAHLGTLDFVAAKENVIYLGPPGIRGSWHCRFFVHDDTTPL